MIRFLLPTLFFLTFCRGGWGEEKPASYSLERYSVIWKKSMFSRPVDQRKLPNSSIYWSLAGVFSYEGGKGAVIVNQASGAVEQIELGKKNEAGLTLVEVIEDEGAGTVVVKVDENGKSFFVTKQTRRGEKDMSRPVASQ